MSASQVGSSVASDSGELSTRADGKMMCENFGELLFSNKPKDRAFDELTSGAARGTAQKIEQHQKQIPPDDLPEMHHSGY